MRPAGVAGFCAEDAPLGPEKEVAEFDECLRLAGARLLAQCLPQRVLPQRMGPQQQVQRHALLGALRGALAEHAVVTVLPLGVADPAQEEAHAVPDRGGHLPVLQVAGQLRVTGEALEGAP
ncbi:hypothetical protein [Streptomyces sp. NPDC059788]|uniref:hypothetical protein n=1 Tax=Streptomyces sp. NPDC059788 TaxID=3346948 RepID=UPI00365889C4